MLEIRMLGQFDVRIDGRVTNIPSRPAQSLLAYLALSAGTAHRREKLAGLFWPDSTEVNARSSLRHALWRIRKEIGGDAETETPYLLVDSLTIAFADGGHTWVDALVLARETAKDSSPENLIGALSLYGGDLLPGFYDDWVILERERIRAVFDHKMQAFLDQCLANHQWPLALEWAERWIGLGQVPEPAYQALMIAYSYKGDVAGVAASFQRCQDALMDELGVQPSELTREIYERSIRGDARSVEELFRQVRKLGETAELGREELGDWSALEATQLMIDRALERGDQLLDKSAVILASSLKNELTLDEASAALLLRSALFHDEPFEPWLAAFESADAASGALSTFYETRPDAKIRRRIVSAFGQLQNDKAAEALLHIAVVDEALAARSAAALESCRLGHQEEIMNRTLAQASKENDPVSLGTLAILVNEYGLPENSDTYTKIQVTLTLARRRWRTYRRAVWRQARRLGLIGTLIALYGAATPPLMKATDPSSYQINIESDGLAIWIFSLIVFFSFFGFLQGFACGFFIGLADAIWVGGPRRLGRLLLSSPGGLVYALIIGLFSGLQPDQPAPAAIVFVPLTLLLGLVFGALVSLVTPALGETRSRSRQRRQMFIASLVSVLVNIPYMYIIIGGLELYVTLSRSLLIALLPLVLGLPYLLRANFIGPVADNPDTSQESLAPSG